MTYGGMQTSTLFPGVDLSSTSAAVERDTASAPRVRCQDRGLGPFLVRGVRCVALGSALAYNVMHFAGVLLG